MIHQIQQLHETKHSIEQRLSEVKKKIANKQTSINNYCLLFQEEKELKEKLFDVERSLRDLL